MQTVMMVSDLGLTFGRANVFNRNGVGSANFQAWADADIWLDPDRCIGNLPRSHTGTLENPLIKEPGRKFLADLLVQLSDAQLHDLFDVARLSERVQASKPGSKVEDWVAAFKHKREQVVNHSCPS